MKKTVCQYALLRFRPFIETGEFANVGVVLVAPETGFFDFRLITRHGRVTTFFHQLDRQVYLTAMRLFRNELGRFAKQIKQVNATVTDYTLTRNLFDDLVRLRESVLQFGEQRVVLADDPAVKLDELFDHYIERDFVNKTYQERLLENGVRRVLEQDKVGADFKRAKVGANTDFAVTFPFVRMQGDRADRIIKPLYLAHENTTDLLDHGGVWIQKVKSLRRRSLLPENVLFPVTAPLENAKTFEAFAEIQEDLRRADVQVVPANDEMSILRFATV